MRLPYGPKDLLWVWDTRDTPVLAPLKSPQNCILETYQENCAELCRFVCLGLAFTPRSSSRVRIDEIMWSMNKQYNWKHDLVTMDKDFVNFCQHNLA